MKPAVKQVRGDGRTVVADLHQQGGGGVAAAGRGLQLDGTRGRLAEGPLQQVGQDLPEPDGIAARRGRKRFVDLEREFKSRGPEPRRVGGGQALDDLAGAEGSRPDRQATGFDPGEVQQVIHQRQQLPSVVPDPQQVVLRRRITGGLLDRQLREAQQARQRRPEFVAHLGQERALGAAGPLGRDPGTLGLLEFLAVDRDIDADAHDADHPSEAVGAGHHRGLGPSAAGEAIDFPALHAVPGLALVHDLLVEAGMVDGPPAEVGVAASDDVPGVAGADHAGEGRVVAGVGAVGVLHVDGHRQCIEHRVEAIEAVGLAGEPRDRGRGRHRPARVGASGGRQRIRFPRRLARQPGGRPATDARHADHPPVGAQDRDPGCGAGDDRLAVFEARLVGRPLAVGLDGASELAVATADDGLPPAAERGGEGLVDQQISAVDVLGEDQFRQRIEHPRQE